MRNIFASTNSMHHSSRLSCWTSICQKPRQSWNNSWTYQPYHLSFYCWHSLPWLVYLFWKDFLSLWWWVVLACISFEIGMSCCRSILCGISCISCRKYTTSHMSCYHQIHCRRTWIQHNQVLEDRDGCMIGASRIHGSRQSLSCFSPSMSH